MILESWSTCFVILDAGYCSSVMTHCVCVCSHANLRWQPWGGGGRQVHSGSQQVECGQTTKAVFTHPSSCSHHPSLHPYLPHPYLPQSVVWLLNNGGESPWGTMPSPLPAPPPPLLLSSCLSNNQSLVAFRPPPPSFSLSFSLLSLSLSGEVP